MESTNAGGEFRTLDLRKLSSLIFFALCLSSCNSAYQNDCEISDNFIWSHVLSQTFEDGGNMTVSSKTSFHYFNESDWDERQQAIRRVSRKLNVPGCDISRLANQLLERNKGHANLTLESSLDLGFIVVNDSVVLQYFSPSIIGGWERWYKDHPNSHGITTVSLPVCDADCGVVLVYRSTQKHYLNGSGWLLAYRIEGSTLIAVDSVMLWIS